MARELGATLDALKRHLQVARKFSEPWEQFHDEVAVPHIRSPIGVPADNPQLERCLTAISQQLFNNHHRPSDHSLRDPCFSHVPEHGFWHGTAWVGGMLAICFYFEDPGAGLVGFMRSPYDDEVYLARVRLVELPAGANWNRMAGAARCN